MLRSLLTIDGLVARTRPAWGWLGQVALCWLGAHLAADTLDDLLGGWLAGCGIAWPEPEQPLIAGTWAAVVIELVVAGWVLWVRSRSLDQLRTAKEWTRRWSIRAIVAPVAFGVFGLAGAWVLAMAVEDGLAPLWPAVAGPAGTVTGLVIAARLAVPGAWRTVVGTPVPRRRWDGALAAAPVLLLTVLAARHGLPVWGWLP
ncbi:MAG: hypothetical protein H6738_06655 [Alphaproteobacteria bacterium]|nr:hypothetical protein [Alphaproteobacteria bacterium]MCB9696442.1 hypothetical protein [Alphaproteobacteria bacterium]